MRPVATLFLLALPLAAAPVPKGMKAKTFEQRLLGTWRYLDEPGDRPTGKEAFIAFRAGGEVEQWVETAGGGRVLTTSGQYQIGEAEPPFVSEVRLTFPDSKNLTATWVVTELTDDGMKVINTTAGAKERFERKK